MNYTTLGKTNLKVSRSAFGALPVQRVSLNDAVTLFNIAYAGGINFYDTARGYSDSEEKLGTAFCRMRDKIIIATKTLSRTPEGFWADLETSLNNLKTDYIDIYQFHNPPDVPLSDSPLYGCMLRAKSEGKIRHIGITAHRVDNAREALKSGLYDTIQYPLSALSSDTELSFARECAGQNVGVIAMKALCGGLLPSAAPTMAFLREYMNTVPIWGFQRASEIEEVLSLEDNPPALNEKLLDEIEGYRRELSGNFCRGCGYCKPCEAGIDIDWCARMPLLLRRAVWQNFMTDAWRKKMGRISSCTGCYKCRSRCPYNLDAPALLKTALSDYNDFAAAHGAPRVAQ